MQYLPLVIGSVIVLIVVAFAYLLLSNKITLYNTMFGQGYGLKLISGEFGAGKTKNVFQSAFLRKQENPHGIVISNLNYNFTDIYFDNKEDFSYLLKFLVRYIQDTNNIDALKKNYNFPPIKVIVDEAHLYLFARDFKAFSDETLLVLTQCRKRSISIDFITQELGQIDVIIRRLVNYIHYFKPLPFGFRSQYLFYQKDSSSVDIKDELAFEALEHSFLAPDSWVLKLKPKLQEFYDQKYLTKWVCGALSSFDKDYEHFYDLLRSKVISYRKSLEPKPKLPKKSILSSLKSSKDDTLEKINAEQKKLIEKIFSILTDQQVQEINNYKSTVLSNTIGETDTQGENIDK